MSRVLPWDDREGVSQTTLEQNAEVTTQSLQPIAFSASANALDAHSLTNVPSLAQASQLSTKAKVALIRQLLKQLETNQIQSILEFGLREIADRDRRNIPAMAGTQQTRLLLKKDYSYQDRGLSQPTQYYVYLRRRKPKLDRYIGTLFYVPEGCTLSYALDAAERIVFNPPHNIFRLQDTTQPDQVQIVRLLYLEPPPSDYTFDKQQNDTPAIYLHLEYLESQTFQTLSCHRYPFPSCMYEGGELDRYRWQVSPVLQNIAPSQLTQTGQTTLVEPLTESTLMPARRVLTVPPTRLIFHLANPADGSGVLKRMRLWVTWSEKAIPQSRWQLVADKTGYTLMNARFQRQILSFSPHQATVTLENSLPVLMKWFHDLSLAVSQAQSQQYSTTQRKLAHTLFVEMNLPQNDPIVVLRQLFGVEFYQPTLVPNSD